LDESQAQPSVLFRWLKNKVGLDRVPKEIQQVIDESEERGIIDEEQGEMIEGIFDLKQTVAREIMIPRTYVVAIPLDSSIESILSTVIDSGHSRIPVFKENVDQIVGILNAKDLLPFWLDQTQEFDLSKIIREPFFVPETKQIKDLLNELRNKKSHLAVIVDEYGGTSGLVTIEDIVEEIIGEIRDEHDAEEDDFAAQPDGSFLVNAWANLDDFEELFCVKVPREGYDTVGGFIIHLLGKVPKKGEEINFEGLQFKIHRSDPKKITRVLVTSQMSAQSHDGSGSVQSSE
jgi:CBS domain containing-hemolysin-like protein